MDTKLWYQSTTIQGLAVTLITQIVTWVNFTAIDNSEIAMAVSSAFTLIGIAYAVYGRMKTNGEKITIK